MNLFYLLFLLIVTGSAAVLAYENPQEVPVTLFNVGYTTSVPVIVGSCYVAGMLSGWTLLGLLRRALHRVARDAFEDGQGAKRN